MQKNNFTINKTIYQVCVRACVRACVCVCVIDILNISVCYFFGQHYAKVMSYNAYYRKCAYLVRLSALLATSMIDKGNTITE